MNTEKRHDEEKTARVAASTFLRPRTHAHAYPAHAEHPALAHDHVQPEARGRLRGVARFTYRCSHLRPRGADPPSVGPCRTSRNRMR